MGSNKEIKEELKPLVELHGEDLIEFVVQLQMARLAAEDLASLVNKHQSNKGRAGLTLLANAYNELAQKYMIEKGWTLDKIDELTQSVGIALTPSTPRVVLN